MVTTLRQKVLLYALVLLLFCNGLSAVTSFLVSKRIIVDGIVASKKNELIALDGRMKDSLVIAKEKLDLLAGDLELREMADEMGNRAMTAYERSALMNQMQNYMKSKLYSMKEFRSVMLFSDPWAIGVGTDNEYQFVKNITYEEKVHAANLSSAARWIGHIEKAVPGKSLLEQHITVSQMDETSVLVGIFDYSGLLGDKKMNLVIYDDEMRTIYNHADSLPYLPDVIRRMDKNSWNESVVKIQGQSYVHIQYRTPEGDRNYSLLLDERTIQDKFRQPLMIIVSIGFAVFVLFSFALYLLSKRLLRPIDRFGEVLSEIDSSYNTANLDRFIQDHDNRASMKKQLFLFYSICVVPLFIVIWTNYVYFRDVVIDEAKTNDFGTLEEVHSHIEYTMRNYTMIIQYFSLDHQVQKELIRLAGSGDIERGSEYMSDLLLNKGILGQNIQYLKFYDAKYNLVYSSNNLTEGESTVTTWKTVLQHKTAQYYWDLSETDRSGMLLFGKIKYFPHPDALTRVFKGIGYVEMSVKPFIFEKLGYSRSDTDKAMMIIDKERRILFASRKSDEDQMRIRSMLNESGLRESRNRIVDFSDSDYMITVRGLENSDWFIVQLVPLQGVKQANKRIFIDNLYIVAVFFLLALMMSEIMSKRIVKPMYKLNRFMQTLDVHKLNHLEASQRGNEFAELARNFKDMLHRLQKMSERIKEKELESLELEKRKKEAQLTALQMQMNPHFLYNIFTSIHLLIKMNQNERAAEMIQATGKLLRYGLYRGNQLISVQEELDHVSAFIAIQSIRYKERIKVEWHIEDEVRSLRMPRFIMQPLVENVFEHAFTISRPLLLTIRIYKYNDACLMIEVQDDGVGIPEDELVRIRELLNHDTPSEHIGLVNVNERIQLFYGREYHLQIDSEKNKGTVVTVKLPLISEV